MRFPLSLTMSMAGYMAKKKFSREKTLSLGVDARTAARV